MSMPEVSVIINCFNGGKFLREAIDSVYEQTYDDWEIIFWDNASTDDSVEIIKDYDDRIRYFRSDKTYLLGKARNLAFKQARGKFIAILDTDDIWLPQKLKKQIPLFVKNSELGMIYSDSIFFDHAGDKYNMHRYNRPHRGNIFGELLVDNFVSTETMIYRRSALESMDYIFDDNFTMVMDYDLSLRVAYLFELDYVCEPLSRWRIHPGSESSRKRFLIVDENLMMIDKLIKELPDIERMFGDEITIFKKSLDYQFALKKWFLGDRRGARKGLRPYLMSKKFLITYFLTAICSYNNFESIKTRIKKLQYNAIDK